MNNINSLILSNEMTVMIIASILLIIILIIAVIKINKTHKKNIEEFYNKDILTNKYNYQGFINQLEKIKKVKRWTVICFDIDSFKQVNKNHDYDFGDEVLKLIATNIDELLEDNGIIGRIESNRYLVGFPSDYKKTDIVISDIENEISRLEYKRFKFSFEITLGYYNGSQNDEIKEVVSLAIEDWLKNKRQKELEKLRTIEAASKEEIAKLADEAKLRQEDSNQKLELVLKTKEEVSLIEIETAKKLEESNRNIEIANEKIALSQAQLQEVIKLKSEADAKFLEAKNMSLEAEGEKTKAKIQMDEALRIKSEAESLKAEALRIKEEAERNKHDVEREQYEARRTKEDAQRLQDEAKRAKEDADRERQNAYDMKRQAYEDSKYQRRDMPYHDDYYDSRRYHNNSRDYDYNNPNDKDPRIIINTQQDSITERRVEEIINSVLLKEKAKNNENNNDSSSRLSYDDIELMVRRIVMDSMKAQEKDESSKDVKQLEYKDYSKKETDKLSSDELEAAIRNVMGEYMTAKESENQTKKEKAHEAEEKEKITDLLTRLIDLQEKSQQERDKEVIVINHSQNETKEDAKVDVIHPSVEPEIIYSSQESDEEDEEDDEDEDEHIPQEFIDQLDSKLDIKQFQALMDEYMQKYNQHDPSEVEVSAEKAKTLPFIERVNLSSRDSKTYYNMIKNKIMERDGLVNIITNRYDTFKVGRKVLFKIAYVGKTLKLYLPLDPNLYPNGQYPHKDVSEKKKHVNTPYMMKIKSNLGLKRALVLIEDSMIKLNLEKKSDYKNADYVARNRNLIMKSK